tara:strand:- start:1389 stop:1841 length:453 start_codon:yes stop_codon:yes gene_type:complete
MKKLFFLLIIICFYGCGYSSVYQDQKKDLRINVNNMKGDFELNNFIKNNLKIASNPNSNNIYNLSYNSEYRKNALTKDATGKITDYKIEMIVNFIIDSRQGKIITFKENFNIKSNNENFEQSSYEREIKKNFADSVKNELILNLLKINDN